jgi:shikimate kinase
VGLLLARALGAAYVDSDGLIEELAGKSIVALFEEGEERFRALEEAAIERITSRARGGERLVAATGGGAVLRRINVERLRSAGLVIWLSAPAETLRRRLLADEKTPQQRPPLRGASAACEIESVLAEREPRYRAAAHLEVSSEGLDAAAVAARVLASLDELESSPGAGRPKG